MVRGRTSDKRGSMPAMGQIRTVQVHCTSATPGTEGKPDPVTEQSAESWTASQTLPIGRLPRSRACRTPDEVAQCIAFLASDKGSFVTGEILCVERGRLTKRGDQRLSVRLEHLEGKPVLFTFLVGLIVVVPDRRASSLPQDSRFRPAHGPAYRMRM